MAGRIPRVVVIGPAYVDMAIKCDRIPGPGQTMEGSGFSCVPTGAGPNCAVEAALCDCDSYLLGKVGDDLFGNMICQSLARNGVNTDFVYKATAISTGIIVTMVDSLGENGCCVSQGANRALGGDEVGCALAEQLIASADVCLINAKLGPDVAVTAIRTAQLNRTRVILKAKLRVAEDGNISGLDWPIEYYNANILIADIVFSTTRTESSAGVISEMKFVGAELVAKGLECVVINMGTRGAMVIDRNGHTHIEDFDVKRVDRTACGDAFAGALAASYGSGDSPQKASRFACAAYAIASSRFGGMDSLPKKAEIIELLQNLPD